jgi:acetylornithine deacetylase
MIRRLVASPSVSAIDADLDQSNRGVIDLVAEFAEAAGFHVDVLPVPNAPGKCNLVARIGEGTGGLLLSGHTDTVPYDADDWTSDPFTLTERDGRLYGLGATDMKGFFGLALEAASSFERGALRAPLTLLATADEESTMAGARALAAHGPLGPSYAVIGEPTDLAPVSAHKGIIMERLELVGRSGHSSDPANGRSALEAMHRVLSALMAWRSELERDFVDDRFTVPTPTMNFGRIEGGDAANRICARCQLTLDLRPVPGLSQAVLRDELRLRVNDALAGTGVEACFEEVFGGVPAFECPSTAAILRAAEEFSGLEGRAVMFGTEGPYMQEMGMETIVLGAGSIDVAHRPDEYLEIRQMEPGVRLYRKLIHRFCVEGDLG